MDKARWGEATSTSEMDEHAGDTSGAVFRSAPALSTRILIRAESGPGKCCNMVINTYSVNFKRLKIASVFHERSEAVTLSQRPVCGDINRFDGWLLDLEDRCRIPPEGKLQYSPCFIRSELSGYHGT